jgi:hypothetical protein
MLLAQGFVVKEQSVFHILMETINGIDGQHGHNLHLELLLSLLF